MDNASGYTATLQKTGNGLGVITANNTFSGGTTLTAGILAPSALNSLGATFSTLSSNPGTVTFSGGAIRLYSTGTTSANELYPRFKTPVSGQSYRIDVINGYSSSFSNAFAAGTNVGFEKLGDGTLTFN
ncbi:MAG: hypothetical protein EBU30_03970, partial [Synechococcaceae bacterium WB6_3B_236]|nr:hypothetical protein [Synechococcaceae bacterium WB6_3B_236]